MLQTATTRLPADRWVAIDSRSGHVADPHDRGPRPLPRPLIIAIALSLAAGAVSAQAANAARPEDVTTLDGIMKAYYDVVSGPPGSLPNPTRDHTLHHPDARITLIDRKADGSATARIVTLDGFYQQFGTGPRKKGFFEHEIHRVTQRIGSLVHVWSTYESAETPGGPVTSRGINSIQLVWDGKRFWITSWVFDDERNGNRVPKEYLP
jgi:hypothetical protein